MGWLNGKVDVGSEQYKQFDLGGSVRRGRCSSGELPYYRSPTAVVTCVFVLTSGGTNVGTILPRKLSVCTQELQVNDCTESFMDSANGMSQPDRLTANQKQLSFEQHYKDPHLSLLLSRQGKA